MLGEQEVTTIASSRMKNQPTAKLPEEDEQSRRGWLLLQTVRTFTLSSEASGSLSPLVPGPRRSSASAVLKACRGVGWNTISLRQKSDVGSIQPFPAT